MNCRITILKTALAPAIRWIQHGLCDQVKLTACWMQVAKFVLSRRKTVIPRNRLVKRLQRAHAEAPLTCLEMDDFYLSATEFPSLKIIIWAVYWVGWMHSKTITLQLQQQFQLLSPKVHEFLQAPSDKLHLYLSSCSPLCRKRFLEQNTNSHIASLSFSVCNNKINLEESTLRSP